MPTATTQGSFRSPSAVDDDAVLQRLTECRSEFLGFFQRRLRRPDEAEDAFQDFCVKVICAARNPKDSGKVDAWLRRVMRNSLIDHYRRRGTRQRAMDAYAAEPAEAIVQPDMEQVENPCCCVGDILPTLRPDYAEIVRRVDLAEEPRERVAAGLGLTPNNVGVRLHRARRALKNKLEERCSSCSFGSYRNCDCSPPTRTAGSSDRRTGLHGGVVAGASI